MTNATKKELIEKQIVKKRKARKYCKIAGAIGAFFAADFFYSWDLLSPWVIMGLPIVFFCVIFHYDLGKRIDELELLKAEK